jgi:hypothetical protein
MGGLKMKYPKEFCFRGAPDMLGRALCVSRTTVYGWKRENHIPDRYANRIDTLLRKVNRRSPVPKVKPEPVEMPSGTQQITLADIAQTIADYLRQKGL